MTTNATIPPATPPAADPPAPPAGAPPPAPPAPAGGDPAWLPERIAQAKKNAEADLLKSLGVTTPDEAKAAIAAAKSAADAKKTDAERAATVSAELEKERAKSAALEKTVAERATFELSQLTDAQRDAVESIAGDDSAAQLRAVTSLKPTWATAPAQQQQAPAGKPPLPAPASTTGAAPPPPANTPPAAPTNAAEVYDELKKTHPMLASAYLESHGAEITAARKAKPQ